MNYYISIDGGGTKTKFALFDTNGEMLLSLIKDNCHIMQNSSEAVFRTLSEGIEEILSYCLVSDSNIIISMGLGGYGSTSNKQKIDTIVQDLIGNKYRYIVTNDAEIALLGAHNGQNGAILIAGTGSILLYFDGHQFKRYGGWGYQLGDEGSGYWVGQKLLSHFTKEVDHLMMRSEIYYFIMDKFSLRDPHDLLYKLTNSEKGFRTTIASLAYDTSGLAAKGNVICKGILAEAGCYLAHLCNQSIGNIGNVNLAIYGGLWNSGRDLIDSFLLHKAHTVTMVEPQFDACKGAYILAKHKFS